MRRSSVHALAEWHDREGHGFSRAGRTLHLTVIPSRFSGEESAFPTGNSRFLDSQNDLRRKSSGFARNDMEVWRADGTSKCVLFASGAMGNA